MLTNADGPQARANRRYAAQRKAQVEADERGKALRRAEQAKRLEAIRAIQRQTRITAITRKLAELRGYALTPEIQAEIKTLKAMLRDDAA